MGVTTMLQRRYTPILRAFEEVNKNMANLSASLSDREKHEVIRLLPYWGLSYDKQKDTVAEGMKHCATSLCGLSKPLFHELSRLLAHTGVQLEETVSTADLYCTIEIKKNTPAPLTLQTNATTFYLKPLRKRTDDVQTWIHKRLWLPVHDKRLTLTFHSREEGNLAEWLSYLIIQHFMRNLFRPLSDIIYPDYQRAVIKILEKINPALARCQLSLEPSVEEEWPEFPLKPGSESKRPHSIEKNNVPGENPIDPFRHHDKTRPSTINPFHEKGENKPTTIDPFRKRDR
jgi:hypothetical protein